ncbi:MAG: LysM peptidoglycan-binding domain-containing protein, partial [Alistipes sp.]|nr:LysM peptidoglycan-binding domain-containing protein [Alistipes sp.]
MIKKRCLLLIAALFVAISVAFATEPQVVVFNGKKYVAHTIVSGDTLYSLSKAYGVTEDDIIKAAMEISGERL